MWAKRATGDQATPGGFLSSVIRAIIPEVLYVLPRSSKPIDIRAASWAATNIDRYGDNASTHLYSIVLYAARASNYGAGVRSRGSLSAYRLICAVSTNQCRRYVNYTRTGTRFCRTRQCFIKPYLGSLGCRAYSDEVEVSSTINAHRTAQLAKLRRRENILHIQRARVVMRVFAYPRMV